MDYFLIDFENMPISNGTYLEEMHAGDVIIIFYSDMCNEISLDLLEAADKLNIESHYQKANIGTKNALDFQLSSYLGYLIGKGTLNSRYHIVSKDKGYDCLCNYWRSQNISVDRITFAKPAPFSADEISIIPLIGEPQYQKQKLKLLFLMTLTFWKIVKNCLQLSINTSLEQKSILLCQKNSETVRNLELHIKS